MLLPGGGDWELVEAGESATSVYRRGLVYAKTCGPTGVAELVAERDRCEWLAGTPIPGARVLDWIEGAEGAALLTSAVPGVAAGDLPWSPALVSGFAGALRALHELPVASCPFERRLDDVVAQAADVVRRGAVNPDFLTDESRLVAPEELLARVLAAAPSVSASLELVVCHGDACLPNFLFDPDTLEWTGMIDLGRLGVADRYSDLALAKAQLEDEWSADPAGFFAAYGEAEPDARRLDFYLQLDPLTWG
ncbi:aminoglycoside 3'-phosphotransferase [Kribbella sp. NPDC056861]|uniref:aminoglycoside 3'-phosphotransferase n=1 Tax=Kribbella sp. NPDC056861 TaxID=3154857 RepID=UPI0034121591